MNFVSKDNEKRDRGSGRSRYIYWQEGCPLIFLNRGIEAFYKCVDILTNTPPRPPLQLDTSLNFLIPEDRIDWTNALYLKTQVTLKKYDLKGSLINAFHFDIGANNPEISLILQLVDDNSFNGIRRMNLLNAKYKYVGITHKLTNTLCCSYFFFSDVSKEFQTESD